MKLLKPGTLTYLITFIIALAAALLAATAQAANWSDTSIGFRTGSKFAEPFGSTEIKKGIVYRHTLEAEKVIGSAMKFGPVRGLGLTFGFDVNAKTDAG